MKRKGTKILEVGAFIFSVAMLILFTSGTVYMTIPRPQNNERVVQLSTSGPPTVKITKFEFPQPTVKPNEQIPIDIEVELYKSNKLEELDTKYEVAYYSIWARNTSNYQVFYGSSGMSADNDYIDQANSATSLGYYAPGVYKVEGLTVALRLKDGPANQAYYYEYIKAADCNNQITCDNSIYLQKSFTMEDVPFEDNIPIYEYSVGINETDPEVAIGDRVNLTIRRLDKFEEVYIERKEIKTMMLNFTNETDGNVINVYVKSPYYDSYIIVPSTATAGKYHLNFGYLTFTDDTSARYQNTETKTFAYNSTFIVKEKEMDKSKYEFNNEQYGEAVAKDLSQLNDDAIITVNANNLPIIDENVFKSIQNTKQTLIIEYSTSEWVFSGSDIKNPKAIDVSTMFEKLTEGSQYYDEFLKKNLTGSSALLKFSDNGDLPGKVLIKIDKESVDLALDKPGKVFVYFYKEDSDNLVKVAMEVQSNNGFYEFYINHNSKYIMTTEEANEKVVSEDLEMLSLNHQLVIQQGGQLPMIYIIATICGGIAIIFLGMMLGRKRQQQGQQQTQG